MSTATPISFGRSANPRVIRCTLYALIAVGLLRFIPAISFADFHNDFSHYYIGGALVANGQNPYTEPLEAHSERFGVAYDPTIPFAAHPPLLLWFFSCLSLLAIPVAYGVWLGIQFSCLVGCLELTRRILGFKWNDVLWLAIVGIYLNATSLQSLVYYSQAQMIVGLLLYAALFLFLRGRTSGSCVLFTLAAAVKIYPLVLAPWFLFAGERRLGEQMRRITAMASTALFCLLLPGIRTWLDFVTIGIPALDGNAIKWTNYSVQNLVLLLIETAPDGTLLPVLTANDKLLAMLASLAAIGSAYGLILRRGSAPKEAFSILLVPTMIGGIICWAHYFTILLLPVALLWRHAGKWESPRLRFAALAAGLLIWMPTVDIVLLGDIASHPRLLLHFYPLLGCALLAFLLPASQERRNATAITPAAGACPSPARTGSASAVPSV